MRYDIFISYSQRDKELVHKYAEHLVSIGYNVWYDVKGLSTGVKFTEEIVFAIENSTLFLYFSSKNSNTSDWTSREISYAADINKIILPIKIDNSEYSIATKLILTPLQYICINQKLSKSVIIELDNAIQKFIKPTIQQKNDSDAHSSDDNQYNDDSVSDIDKSLFEDLKFLAPIIDTWFHQEFNVNASYKDKRVYKQLATTLYKKITIIEEEIVTIENKRKQEFARDIAGDEAKLKVAYKKFSILYNKNNYDLADKIVANEFSKEVEMVKEKYKILLSKIKYEVTERNRDSLENTLFQIEKSPHFEYLSMGLISSLASNISNIILQKISYGMRNVEDSTIYDKLVNSNNELIFNNILQRIKNEIMTIIECAEKENIINQNQHLKKLKQKQVNGFAQLEVSYNNLINLASSPSQFKELVNPVGEYTIP